MDIYIVRHGETIWNEKTLLQGRTDSELNENGRKLAIIT
ncbi:histidine phosphatase family protein, partial [Coprococcus eutactus]